MTNEWTPCKKIKTAFMREVKGKKERVDTREGITWAYAATDFVMCGQDDNGKPDSTDMYPIKKERFHETYEIVEHSNEIALMVTKEDVFLIRKALDQYKASDDSERAIQRDLLTWLHTDFDEAP